jgi:hypothetical protein
MTWSVCRGPSNQRVWKRGKACLFVGATGRRNRSRRSTPNEQLGHSRRHFNIALVTIEMAELMNDAFDRHIDLCRAEAGEDTASARVSLTNMNGQKCQRTEAAGTETHKAQVFDFCMPDASRLLPVSCLSYTSKQPMIRENIHLGLKPCS